LPETDLTAGRYAGFAAHLLNLILLLAMWGFAAWTYDALPDPMPVHFCASGAPDRFVEKSTLEWMVLPLSALGMTVLLYASALLVPLVRRKPHLVNLTPGYRRKFVGLSPSAREPILAVVSAMIFWMAVPTNGLLLWLLVDVHAAVSSGRYATSPWAPMGAFFLCFAAAITIFLVWLHRAIDAAADREAEAARSGRIGEIAGRGRVA
jgi:uncharacterized membrane protein